MKHYILIALMFTAHILYGQAVLNADDSDPRNYSWMKGFPPHPDSVLSAIDGSFFNFPALRYSVCHMREFFPTVNVAGAQTNRYKIKARSNGKIDTLTFFPLGSTSPMTWRESLQKNYTDGIVVLHRGKVVYEKYFGALAPNGLHAAMSVSKTLTGTLGALLVEQGLLDETKLCRDYLPELANSAFGDATIRQVLDMTTGLQYSEDYSDPNAEIWAFTLAGNPFPKPVDYTGPRNSYDYLITVKKQGEHGTAFGYKTVNTDVMGWLISRVTGMPLAELLSEKIWKPMGAHYDGYYQIDGSGIAFAGGGFNANLRDLAMFGEMIRNNGYFNGRQILPAAVVADIRRGGDQAAFAKAGYKNLENGSYRNMWWILHNEHGAFSARGVHGQALYIDPQAEMVIARFASHPQASNSANDPYSLPAYHAVAKYLLNNRKGHP